MLTDIEIAQNAKMKNITDIASDLGISADEIEPYGHYKAKISDSVMKRLADKKNGKLVLVTAVNPTPAGEGKTTVSIGLGQSMNKIGKKTIVALREPSLGPVFGIKAAPQAADIRRSFLWRTSISISRAICTPSPLPTTLCAQCLITVFSRGTSLISTLAKFRLSVALI